MSFSADFIGSPFSISRATITLPGSTAGGGAPMPISKPLFFCPNCKALYQVVKAEAGPETADREITCQECKAPLPAREGKFILKYFMLRKAARLHKSRQG